MTALRTAAHPQDSVESVPRFCRSLSKLWPGRFLVYNMRSPRQRCYRYELGPFSSPGLPFSSCSKTSESGGLGHKGRGCGELRQQNQQMRTLTAVLHSQTHTSNAPCSYLLFDREKNWKWENRARRVKYTSDMHGCLTTNRRLIGFSINNFGAL